MSVKSGDLTLNVRSITVNRPDRKYDKIKITVPFPEVDRVEMNTPKTLFSSTESKRIKLGFIGTGLRGQWMVHLTTKYPEVSIPAICYIDKIMIASTLKILKNSFENDNVGNAFDLELKKCDTLETNISFFFLLSIFFKAN